MAISLANDRRRATRVSYPAGFDCPRLCMVSGDYAVVDVSQLGLKFSTTGPVDFSVGQRLTAKAHFPDGSAYDANGAVLRIDADGVVLLLDHPLPSEILTMPLQDRRAHLRLRYPHATRPRVVLLDTGHDVVDISERSLRLAPENPDEFPAGMIVQAVLSFHDGSTLPIQGRVSRIDRGEVIIVLDTPIPPERFDLEHNYLNHLFTHGTQ